MISCPSLININCLTSTLRTLKIVGCSALKSLPMSNCTCIEYATIEECNSLMFISRGQLPPTLKRLEINDCENLQFVVDKGEASSSSPSSLLMNEESLCSNYNYESLLEHLEIRDCPSLKYLCDLPATLKHLDIWGCSELTSLSFRNQLPTALVSLIVWFCPKLESIADKLLNNASLEQLEIWNCENLKSLPEGLHKLCHLNKIDINRCPSVVCFPDGGLLPTSLRELSIRDCEKLEALPNGMHNLTLLQELSICDCQSLKSFPEDGYPSNLTSLRLKGVDIRKQVFEWGFHKLISLRYLCIYECHFNQRLCFVWVIDALTSVPQMTALWAIWKCKNVGMFEGKVVNASQTLNYCSHMVTICQEAMVGNHSLRSSFVVECKHQAVSLQDTSFQGIDVLRLQLSKHCFHQVPRQVFHWSFELKEANLLL
ncbi:hypothetical protein CMV_026079 [Castanea mollissima]|uniref:Disease resistance protein n=1 Tax=Castanea mollissima TaxID=60419 RepID=A0A8J4QDX9_9ROSI|nr:hypothetical protein CMV_026079 [Castanea mollissima]